MDPNTSCKHYPHHDFDHSLFIDEFCAPITDALMFKELILLPMKIYSQHLKPGKIFIDFTFGPVLFHLLPMCGYFSEIIVLEPNDSCVESISKWVNKDEGAPDCARALEFMEAIGLSGNIAEKEDLLRGEITRIVKCDLSKENPTEPTVLPKADCLICGYMLEHVSPDKDAFRSNLKKMASYLAVGGCMILTGTFGAKLFILAGSQAHILDYDEAFLREALKEAPLKIEVFEVAKSKASNDNLQYSHTWVVIAIKVEEI